MSTINTEEQKYIGIICDIITIYSAWENDEIDDATFEAQINAKAAMLNIADISEILEHAAFIKTATLNNINI